MTRDGRRLPPREYCHASGLAASIALKKGGFYRAEEGMKGNATS